MDYLISDCCGAIPDHEHVSQVLTNDEVRWQHEGICSDCKEHSSFEWNDPSLPNEDPECQR